MKIHILIGFTNHDAHVEFNRITAVTDIAADDYHRDNIEVYTITICSQCVTPHVIGAHVLPVQQSIPMRCWCCDQHSHFCQFQMSDLVSRIDLSGSFTNRNSSEK